MADGRIILMPPNLAKNIHRQSFKIAQFELGTALHQHFAFCYSLASTSIDR
jgi:hypothetical protein